MLKTFLKVMLKFMLKVLLKMVLQTLLKIFLKVVMIRLSMRGTLKRGATMTFLQQTEFMTYGKHQMDQ